MELTRLSSAPFRTYEKNMGEDDRVKEIILRLDRFEVSLLFSL